MNLIKLNNIPEPFGYYNNDIDLSNIPSYETKNIGLAYLDKLLLGFKNQNISPNKLAKIALTWGRLEVQKNDKFDEDQKSLIDDNYIKQLQKVYIPHLPGVTRITMDVDEHGYYKSPIPYGELDWHSDNGSLHNPFDTLALYAEKGTNGSYTQFVECVTPYSNLSENDKNVLLNLEWYCIFNRNKIPANYSDELCKIAYLTYFDNNLKTIPLIQKNRYGHIGIKYNKITFGGFVNKTNKENDELVKWIESIIFKPENVYTHYWKDGDLLFIDQTVMLHKRPEQDCSKRNLYRILFDTSKLIALLP